MTQEEISIEWIRSAHLPEINHLILPKGDQLPSIAQGIEWITLWSNTTRKHDDCQTDTTVWVSSFLFPSQYRLILKEDAGVRPLFQNQHESKAEIVGVEFYRDPCEILWAPWIEEKYHTMSYHTLDEVGNLIEIELKPTVTSFCWNSPEGEEREWIPSSIVRKELDMATLHSGRLLNSSSDLVAFISKISHRAGDVSSSYSLLINKEHLFEFLRRNSLSLAWGVRLWRESSYPLNTLIASRIVRDWRSTVFIDDSENLQSFPYLDE